MTDTLNTRFINCLYCKITAVTDGVEICSGVGPTGYSTTFFANYQPALDVDTRGAL